MIACEGQNIDACMIKDLKEIPADDFMLLCVEFSQLSLEYQKSHKPISTV